MMNYDEIANRFWEMEKKEHLFEYKLNGVLVWKTIRIYVFEKLIRKINQSAVGHPNQQNIKFRKRLREKILILKLLCSKNAMFNKKTSKYLVFRHRRRINVDGKNIEVNTNFLNYIIDDIHLDNTEYIESGIAFENRNIDSNAQFLLVNPIKNIISFFIYKIIYKIKHKEIDKINHIVFAYFNVDLNLEELIVKNLVGFKNMYSLSFKYISCKSPQGIYLVCSYGKEGLIKAAHDLKVPVFELQHGVITKYHMGYSFPDLKSIPYFPDKLLVYGDYWRTVAKYPIRIENIVSIGNAYFEIQLKKYSHISTERTNIMFISSGDIGKSLSVLASNFAEQKTDFMVYYKLHPSEFSIWKEIYPALTNTQRSNLIIVEDQINLYELFARNLFIVGVNSTALFESFAFEPKLILFNRPGIEYMNDIIDNYGIPLINNVEELITIVNNYPDIAKIERKHFYKKVSIPI